MAKKIPKGAKKKFFEVSVPLTATKVKLYDYLPEMLENKVIRLDLTKNLRGKNLELKAKVKFRNEKLESDLISLEISPQYAKRAVRKGTDYVEDSIEAESRDAIIRIKPLMVTRKRVSKEIIKILREEAKKFIIARAKTRTSQDLFNEVITNKFQKELSIKVKKVYPLALCEIRTIKILKAKAQSPKESPEKEKKQ